jgi:hypothetical protein
VFISKTGIFVNFIGVIPPNPTKMADMRRESNRGYQQGVNQPHKNTEQLSGGNVNSADHGWLCHGVSCE